VRRVAIPVTSSRAVARLIEARGGEVVWTKTEHHAMMASAEQADMVAGVPRRVHLPEVPAGVRRHVRHARMLEALALSGEPLSAHADRHPPMHIRQERVACPWGRKGAVMRRLMQETEHEDRQLVDGVKVWKNGGDEWALIIPHSDKPYFVVTVEARTRLARMRCSTATPGWWPCGGMKADGASPLGASTRAVHAGSAPPQPGAPVVMPIHQTSTFFTDAVPAGEVRYTRYGTNPNHEALARKLCALEGADDAIVVASGNAACALALLSCVGAGGHIAAQQELYGGTLRILNRELPRLGISVDYVPLDGDWQPRSGRRPVRCSSSCRSTRHCACPMSVPLRPRTAPRHPAHR
jgi:hypothetical protein